MTSRLNRRQFVSRTAALAGLAAAGPLSPAYAMRADRMNILCWEGYNSDEVLGPFRKANPGCVRAGRKRHIRPRYDQQAACG